MKVVRFFFSSYKKILRKTQMFQENLEHTVFFSELSFVQPGVENANLCPLIHHNMVCFHLFNQSRSRIPWH